MSVKKDATTGPLAALRTAAARLPAIETTELAGVPCCFMWNSRSPGASVAFCFRDGVAYEPAEKWGVSRLLERAALRGTEGYRSPADIAGAVEAVGGSVSASSTRDMTVFFAKFPSGAEEAALAVLTEVLTKPLLAPEAVAAEKALIVQERGREEEDAGRRLSIALEGMLLSPLPISRHPAGTQESLSTLDNADLRVHLGRRYLRGNMAVGAAGGLTSRFKPRLLAALSRFPQGKAAARPDFVVPGSTEARELLLPGRPGQAGLSLGWSFPVKDRRELLAWRVLDALLGAGTTSMFNQALRESENIADLCTTGFDEYAGTGVFKVSTPVPAQALGRAVAALTRTIEDVRHGLVPPRAAAEAAVRHYAGVVYRFEESLGAAKLLGASLAREGRSIFPSSYLTELEAVRPADLAELAGRRLVPPLRKAVVLAEPGLDLSKLLPV